jgi:acetyltransferase-like isoleucine patch superfamily enzyme
MIHPTAFVSPNTVIGKNVSIGPFTTVYENVEIGDDVNVGGYCELGVESGLTNNQKLYIGSNSTIRSHSVFYAGSTFADGLVTGHRVTVRESTVAGVGLQLGTLCDIQGDCTFGDHVKLHSNVHVGKLSKIEDFVWLFPYVVLTNDPHPPSNVLQGVTISKYAVVATMTVILPGANIAEGVLVGAHSCLKGNTDPHMVYAGSPAKQICPTSKIMLQDGSNRPAYPWTQHFTRGYPEEVIAAWQSRSS